MHYHNDCKLDEAPLSHSENSGLLQRLRTPGSSLVANSDLDYAWPMLQRKALEHMIMEQNLRPGGRGIQDLRPALYKVQNRIVIQNFGTHPRPPPPPPSFEFPITSS